MFTKNLKNKSKRRHRTSKKINSKEETCTPCLETSKTLTRIAKTTTKRIKETLLTMTDIKIDTDNYRPSSPFVYCYLFSNVEANFTFQISIETIFYLLFYFN